MTESIDQEVERLRSENAALRAALEIAKRYIADVHNKHRLTLFAALETAVSEFSRNASALPIMSEIHAAMPPRGPLSPDPAG